MRIFKKKQFHQTIFISAALSILIQLQAGAQIGSPGPKKLIEMGWDKPDTAALRANLAQMEQTPFDGALIGVTGKDDNGKTVEVRLASSNVPWKKEWFQQSVDDLKVVHSQAKKLTDNFIQVGANPGNVDWFDDAGWKQIADHWRIAAWIAKEGNVKGIFFDPEAYTKPDFQFDYYSQSGRDKHTFAEYQAKARQRGEEIINAVTSVNPNVLIFTCFMNSFNAMAAHSAYPQVTMQTTDYNLYPAFINGWLDAAPPGLRLIDGDEGAYRYNGQQDYLYAANTMRNIALKLVAPENRSKYLAQVSTSFGIYLDAYINPPTSGWYIDPRGSTPTQRLGMNLQYALNAANEYVWVYGEKYRWWPTQNPYVRPQGWESALPGIVQTMNHAVHPLMTAEQEIAEMKKSGTLVNLLQNGDFSSAKANVAAPADAPKDWNLIGAPAHWGNWQSGKSHGVFAQDNNVNHTGTNGGAARMAGIDNGCFLQSIEVKPGESYAVIAWMRQTGKGVGWIRVGWQTAEGKWAEESSSVLLSSDGDGPSENWREIKGVVNVPEGAGKMVILLNAANQTSPQDVVWFDDVQVYKLELIGEHN
jgi:hypothetical protein